MFSKLLFVLPLFFFFQTSFAATDALDEVNQYRASHGLRPFTRDSQLSQAAAGCADYRASHLIKGHVLQGNRTDYSFLPRGSWADATGCAAWPPSLGWGSCCSRENWNYAGAAYAYGRDGQRYMHLYVANRRNSDPSPYWKRDDSKSGWWYMKDGEYTGFLDDKRIFRWRNSDGSYSEGQPLEAGEYPKR